MSSEAVNPIILDSTAVFDYFRRLRDQNQVNRSSPDYRAMLDTLEDITGRGRDKGGEPFYFSPKDCFASVDLRNEAQQKFVIFMQNLGFAVDPMDYRLTDVVPNIRPPYQRCTGMVNYMVGSYASLDSSGTPPPLMIVSDDFNLYHTLKNYTEVQKGKATLAFFASGLENRWRQVGLLDDANFPISFLDLDPFAFDIYGCDIIYYAKPTEIGPSPVDSFAARRKQ